MIQNANYPSDQCGLIAGILELLEATGFSVEADRGYGGYPADGCLAVPRQSASAHLVDITFPV